MPHPKETFQLQRKGHLTETVGINPRTKYPACGDKSLHSEDLFYLTCFMMRKVYLFVLCTRVTHLFKLISVTPPNLDILEQIKMTDLVTLSVRKRLLK